MGTTIFDQYTLLHSASGVMFYFFGFSFTMMFIIHTLFEYVENTKYGVYFIDRYFFLWPGGKEKPDEIINSVGDTIGVVLGWLSSYYLDGLYKTS